MHTYKISSGDLVKEIIKVYRIVTSYDINFVPINRVFDAVHFHVYLDYVSYVMIVIILGNIWLSWKNFLDIFIYQTSIFCKNPYITVNYS